MAVTGTRDEDVTVRIGGDASGARRATDAVVGGLQNVSKAAGIASGALAAVGAVGIGKSISAFADFDAAMTESLAIMGDVSESMEDDMAKAAQDVATETQFAAEEAAESYFFLASAGLDAADSIEVLDDMAQFAQSGQFDMARATDILTDSASALGKEVEDYNEVADTFVKANQLANTSVEQVGEAMTSKAGAALRDFNIDLDDGVAALAAYADQGIKGSRAGEVLNRTLLTLSEGARDNEAAFNELGVEVFDAEGEMRDFSTIVGELDGELSDMTTEQRNATLEQMGFTRRTREGIVALLGQSESLDEYREELSDAGGAAEEVADNQMDTLNKQWDLMTDRLQVLGIRIGSGFEKPLRGVLDVANDTIETVLDLTEGIDETRMAFGLTGGTLTSLGVTIGLFISGPIGALIAAAGALTVAWSENWFEIRDVVSDSVGSITDIVDGAGDRMESVAGRASDALGSIDFPTDRARAFAARGLDRVVGGLDSLTDVANENAGPAVDFLGSVMGTAADTASDVLVGALETTHETASELRDVASPLTDRLADVAVEFGIIDEEASGADEILGNVLGRLATGKLAIVDALGDVAGEFRDELAVAAGDAESALDDALDALGSFTAETVRPAFDDISTLFETHPSEWKDEITDINWGGVGEAIGTGVGSGVGGSIELAAENVERYTDWLASEIEGVDWEGLGQDAGSTVGSGIEGSIEFATESVSAYTTALTESIESVEWGETGESVGTAIGEGIKGTTEFAAEAGGEVSDSVLNAIEETEWDDLGADIMRLFIEGVTGMTEFAWEAGDAIGESVEGAIEDVDWVGLGMSIIELIVKGNKAQFEFLWGAWRETAEHMVDAIEETDWVDVGVWILTKIGEGILKTPTHLLPDVRWMTDDVTDEIEDVDWMGVGRDLISSIGDGITNRASDVSNAIIGAVNSAIRAINRALPGNIDLPTISRGSIGSFSVGGTIDAGQLGEYEIPSTSFSVPPSSLRPDSVNFSSPFSELPELRRGGMIERSGLAFVDEGEWFSGVPEAGVDKSPPQMQTVDADTVAEGFDRSRKVDDLIDELRKLRRDLDDIGFDGRPVTMSEWQRETDRRGVKF